MSNDTKDKISEVEAEATLQTGTSGGTVATDVGTRDELKRETEGDAGITRVTKQDKVQTDTGTQSDHSGASGLR